MVELWSNRMFNFIAFFDCNLSLMCNVHEVMFGYVLISADASWNFFNKTPKENTTDAKSSALIDISLQSLSATVWL